MKKVVLLVLMVLLVSSVYAANCSNREPITSSCTCNGAIVSSGYCCYYDPAAGNITYQATQTCGYTKWSPHYPQGILSRPYNVYIAVDTPAANHWLAETSDILTPLGDANPVLMKQYNPNIKLMPYDLIESFIFNPTTGFYVPYQEQIQRAQAYAAAHSCDYEQFFLHFSSDASYVMNGKSINVPGYPGSTSLKNNSRVLGYIWGSDRWFLNFKYPCLREFLAEDYYAKTHNGTGEPDGLFFDEVAVNFPVSGADCCTYSKYGNVLEYANQPQNTITTEYATDLASAFTALRNKSPDKLFLPNTANYYYGIQTQLYTVGYGASGIWQEGWILMGADAPRDYQVAHDFALNQRYDALDAMPGYLPSSLTPGAYATSLERAKMTTLAWYYMALDSTNTYAVLSIHGQQKWAPMDPQVDITSMKYAIGTPTKIIPSGKTSAGGNSGLDGVYEFVRGTDPTGTAYVVYGREFTNALVLHKWPTNYAGARTMNDSSATTITLPGSYYLLRDGAVTDSSPITSIALRNSEGAILIKNIAGCSSSCSNGIDADCNNKIDGSELNTAITRWYADQFVISQLMSIIRQWKAGTC